MKKLKNLFVVGGVLLGTICLTVNAATNYVNTKKININEIGGNLGSVSIIESGSKLYALDEDSNIHELNKNGEIYEPKASEIDMEQFFTEKYPNVKIPQYNGLVGNTLYYDEITFAQEGVEEKEVTFEGIDESAENIDLETVHNGRFVISAFDTEEDDEMVDIMMVYANDGKLIKSFDKASLLEKVSETEYEGQTFLDYHYYSNNTDLYIILNMHQAGKLYIFDLNEELVVTINDEDYNLEGNFLSIFNNSEEKFLYESCTSEFSDCTLKMIDKKGNTTELYKSPETIQYNVYNGFLIVNEYDEEYDPKKTTLYNQALEVLYTADNIHIDLSNSLKDENEFKSFIHAMTDPGYCTDNLYKEVTNGKYTLATHSATSGEIGDGSTKFYVLTIEDSKLVNISGILKDKDGNPLKDYTVELHSTVRTVTTDKNGYFKFDNVEEGKHTLTIKDAKGTVLATKEINVINGTETKLDGDTLYFNEADKGLNLNLKLDGTNLSIASIDKGVSVPKTFDTLTNSIIVLITLTVSTLFIIKKSNRIKYIKN